MTDIEEWDVESDQDNIVNPILDIPVPEQILTKDESRNRKISTNNIDSVEQASIIDDSTTIREERRARNI
tara:strand:- start:466 stop:675 length:210 start_codon:yes stop_codon:yes gene_type:complete